jgi:hypothetical protein
MRSHTLNIYVCFALFFLYRTSHAQDSTMLRKHPLKESFRDRVFVGGNIGFQFGTVTFAEVSPLIGYRFTDKISAGIGATYQYYKYKDPTYQLETNVYGGRVFARYFFTDYLFAHAEYEHLNLEAYNSRPKKRVDVESLLVGGGYFQRISDSNSGIYIMLLYNLTESIYTPYSNPIVRIGVNLGL